MVLGRANHFPYFSGVVDQCGPAWCALGHVKASVIPRQSLVWVRDLTDLPCGNQVMALSKFLAMSLPDLLLQPVHPSSQLVFKQEFGKNNNDCARLYTVWCFFFFV